MINLVTLIIGKDKQPNEATLKKAYLWTLLAGGSTAVSSVIVLMVITKSTGVYQAGVYSIALAIANLMFFIASYNIIGFQVTDIKEKYKFEDYAFFRVISCTIMLLASLVFILIQNYDAAKGGVIFLLCVYRMLDAVSELFQGEYQQKQRIDVAAKLSFMRQVIPDMILISLILCRAELMVALGSAILCRLCVITVFSWCIQPYFSPLQIRVNISKTTNLARDCFPLFISAFMSVYIMNAPKFAIDKMLTTELQAYYNILIMPAMTVHLLASIVYRPMITPMAEWWGLGNFEKVQRRFANLTVLTIGITGLGMIAAYFVGPWTLHFLYGIDISVYRYHLVFIILGGGMNALCVLCSYMITIFRHQIYLILAYGVADLVAFFASPFLVGQFGFTGAIIAYVSIMTVQIFAFIVLTALAMHFERYA